MQKRRRKKKTRNRAAAEKNAISEEGPTYGFGEFLTLNSCKNCSEKCVEWCTLSYSNLETDFST